MRQSILDRLIQPHQSPDPESGESEPLRRERWQHSVEEYKRGVLRDLEWLLNSRETGEPARAPLEELERSIYNYGLPDFASLAAESVHTRTTLLKAIRREIELFEPRLSNVQVDIETDADGADRTYRFVIEAKLLLDPDPINVEFDTVFELDSGHFSLRHEP